MQKHGGDLDIIAHGLDAIHELCEWHDCASAFVRQNAAAIIATLLERQPPVPSLLFTACNTLATMTRCGQRPFGAYQVLVNTVVGFSSMTADATWQLTEAAFAALTEAVRQKALFRSMEAPWPAALCDIMLKTMRNAWERGVSEGGTAEAAAAAAEFAAGLAPPPGLMTMWDGPLRAYNYNTIGHACVAIAALAGIHECTARLVALNAVEVLQTVYRGTAAFGFGFLMPDKGSVIARTASACVQALALLRAAGVHDALTVAERTLLDPLAATAAERGELVKSLRTLPEAWTDASFVENTCLVIRNVAAVDVPCRVGRDRTEHRGSAAAAGGAGKCGAAASAKNAGHFEGAAMAGLTEGAETGVDGTINALTVALQNHIGNPRVAVAACAALRNLCAGHTVTVGNTENLLETVFAAASLHAHGVEDVAFESCAALYAVLHQREHTALKILGEQLHAGSAAVAAMSCHPSSARIAWVGSGVLCRLAELAASDFDVHEEVLASLLDDDAVHMPLIRALREHTGDARVARAASTALKLLLRAESCCSAGSAATTQLPRAEILALERLKSSDGRVAGSAISGGARQVAGSRRATVACLQLVAASEPVKR